MKRFTAPLLVLATGAATLIGSHPAEAHGSAAGGLLGGLTHPLLGLDHLLMLLAVGAAASFLSARLLVWAAAGAVAGAALGSTGFSLPAAELLASLAIAATGGLTLKAIGGASTRNAPDWSRLRGLLVAAGVAVHALLHGLEAPKEGTTLLWWSGALISSTLVCGGAYRLFKTLPLAFTKAAAVAFLALGGCLALGSLALHVGGVPA